MLAFLRRWEKDQDKDRPEVAAAVAQVRRAVMSLPAASGRRSQGYR